MSRTETAGYAAPAVQKAFGLLKLVAESNRGLGTSELAKRLGFSKSTTHGLIQALVKTDALSESPQRKTYFLGPAIVELAFKSWNYLRVSEKAQPVMEELRERIGETIFLGVLSRSRGIIVATAEAANPLNISSAPGTTVPLLAGAVGKVFMAGLSDDQVLERIGRQGLPRFTPRSIVSETVYLSELSRVRKQGYALDNEEYLPGVKAVAVSLGNLRGLPLALWVVGFAGSMTEEKMPAIIDQTRCASERLKQVLDA